MEVKYIVPLSIRPTWVPITINFISFKFYRARAMEASSFGADGDEWEFQDKTVSTDQ